MEAKLKIEGNGKVSLNVIRKYSYSSDEEFEVSVLVCDNCGGIIH